MEANRLSRAEIIDLYQTLQKNPLDNYELLWVLESCLDTSSSVYGLGARPWSAGLLILYRDCVWLDIENEMLLSQLLAPLPERDLYRFYTTNASTLDMIKRWFPQGQLSQSWLCVRNLTKTWRKRFDVRIQEQKNESSQGQIYTFWDEDDNLLASCNGEVIVDPWQELFAWSWQRELDSYWLEQIFGVVTATVLGDGRPIVLKIERENLLDIIQPLGYREFCQLSYYVAPHLA